MLASLETRIQSRLLATKQKVLTTIIPLFYTCFVFPDISNVMLLCCRSPEVIKLNKTNWVSFCVTQSTTVLIMYGLFLCFVHC